MGPMAHLPVMEKNKPSAIAPVRALIYARASQDRLKLMRSISDQISDCRSWCQPLGWTVVRVLRDADRSASQWRTKEREVSRKPFNSSNQGRSTVSSPGSHPEPVGISRSTSSYAPPARQREFST